jgi:hypothetical protein
MFSLISECYLGAACQPPHANQSFVSLSDISLILNTHNSYRSKVAKGLETRGNPGPQPAAANMRKVVCGEKSKRDYINK